MESTQEVKHDLKALRHSAAHILAQAIKRLFPQAKLGIGPAIREGFYYDFDIDGELISTNLERISQEMKKIVEEDIPLEREVLSKQEALLLFKQLDEPYKMELVEGIQDPVSVYRQGEFVDLCRGPHMDRTGQVQYFSLLSVAGAYWRGKEGNPMLTRVYGTSFFSSQELEGHLASIEEAKKRDHRKLGRQLDIFAIYPELGAGLPVYHAKGSILRNIIESFEIEEHLKRGYEVVRTPHISKADLWKTSGHFDFYRQSMYVLSVDGQEDYVLKPMNCPGHIVVYKSKQRSFRDLPLRLFELGTVYRREESGVLHGLLRVRGFTQDDAHIFCTPEQVVDEVKGVLDFCLFMMETFNLGYKVTLSTRPEKSIGPDKFWQLSTKALESALQEKGLDYEVASGEGAFYGPKIDVQMEDALGRLWQGPTIQVDFNLPDRFDLTYVASGGDRERVVMIHRVVLGSVDRFLGVLLEHVGGKFPVWLAPVQAKVLPITDGQLAVGRDIVEKLSNASIRADIDARGEPLNAKIREAQLQHVPYMLIIGKKEVEKGTVSVRKRTGENIPDMSIESFIEMVYNQVAAKN